MSMHRWRIFVVVLVGGELLLTLGFALHLDEPARRLMWLGWVPVACWVSEILPLGIAGLLFPIGGVLLGIVPVREAFTAYADPIIFLFLGSFLIGRAVEKHGTAEWMAQRMIRWSFFTRTPYRLTWILGVAVFLMSMWLSNTATTVTLVPIVLAIGQQIDARSRPRFLAGTLLLTAYAASLGGTATPVGTPPNLIALGLLERMAGWTGPSFLEWVARALPLAGSMFFLIHGWIYLRYLRGMDWHAGIRADTSAPQLSRDGRVALYAFLALILLWFGPDLVRHTLGPSHPVSEWLRTHWPAAVPPVLISWVLFWVPTASGARMLTPDDLRTIDWDTLLLFGGGLTFGTMAIRTRLLEQMLAPWLSRAEHLRGFVVFFGVMLAVWVTELISNTACANLLIPIAITVGQDLGISVWPLVFGVTLGVSMAFMLPVATPPNAIVFGTGHVRLSEMMRTGFVADIISILVLTGGIAWMI